MRNIDFLEKKLEFFSRNTILSLCIIGGISIFFRLYYFPYRLPLSQDALQYFWYAIDTSILWHLPTNYGYTNTGWSIFLSIFFSILHSNNPMDYFTLQRSVGTAISVLTIIPVYLLCNRFFEKSLALVGTSLFAFDPRIIENSVSGLTEPLYIFLVASALFLFLSMNKKIVFTSFAVAALCALVRYEGILLFFVISILFFVRFRKERKVIIKYVIAASIFVLILLPMAYIRIQTFGSDGLTSNVIGGATYGIRNTANDNNRAIALFLYVITGLENLAKYLGWIMVPFFGFFVPMGVLLILKKRDFNSVMIILPIIIMSLPALYAYSRLVQETRYLYVLYPLFCVLSIYTVKFLSDRFKKRNIFLIFLVGGVLLSSWIFLDFKGIDIKHEEEALRIAQYVAKTTKVINEYYPEGKYLISTNILNSQKFPVLSTSIQHGTKILPIYGFNSLEEYIKYGRDNGLTYLVLDNAKRNPDYLNDVFNNEKKYPYLVKVFDSLEHGYRYHLKIYRIDYDKFDLTIHSK